MSLHTDHAHPSEQPASPAQSEPTEAEDPANADDSGVLAGQSRAARVRVAALEGQVELLADERDDLQREVGRLEAAVDQLEAEVETLEDALARKEEELDGMRRRYEHVVAGKDRANQHLREQCGDATATRSPVSILVSWLAGLLPSR